MGWSLIAQGDPSNINSIPDFESQIDEQQRGRLDMEFSIGVPTGITDALQTSLELAGVTEPLVVNNGSSVTIIYRKGAFWLPVIISLALIALVAVMIYLTTWKLSKETSAPVFNTAILGGAILAAGIGYFLFKSQTPRIRY
jgi:hypothetical protein